MNATRTILLLGGTSEGLALADALGHVPHLRVVSSLAGRVSNPRLPSGEVRIGGFGGADGLTQVLREEQIDGVIDATHPFANKISANAYEACLRTKVPLLAISRPPWTERVGDIWHDATDVEDAARIAASFSGRILLTIGRQGVEAFVPYDREFVIRAIEAPLPPLPSRYELRLQRGPFTLEDERRLLQDCRVGVVVSKNSGGDKTYMKIVAARELGIPVVMVRRPVLPQVPSVDSIEAAVRWARGL